MSLRVCPWGLILVAILVSYAGEACAQGRVGTSFTQQNQLNTFGQAQNQTQQLGQTPGQQGLAGQSQFSGQNPAGQQQNLAPRQAGGTDGFIGSDADQLRSQQRARNPQQQRRNLFDFAIESLNDLRESRRQQQANRNAKPPVRVKLKPLFRVAQPSTTEVTTIVRSRLSKALPDSVASVPQVTVSGGTATLQGQVQSDYDRELLAKMVSMQPGISEVDNQMTIGQPDQDRPLLVAPPR